MSGFSKKRFKEILERPEINKSAVAREVGVCRQQINAWLNTRRNPSLNSLYRVARFFDKPLEYFFDP